MKNCLIITLLLCSAPIFAQRSIDGVNALVYQIVTEDNTIEYLRFSSDTSKNKPTLLFLQGSLPSPLIMDFGSFKHVNLPFNYQNFLTDFDVAVVSMPHTPLIVSKEQLNDQFCYVTDSADQHSFDPDFMRANTLRTYVDRTHEVIKDIGKRSGSKIHVIGHSQGAKVAAVVASENDLVKSVSFLGFNPFGRFDEMIRRKRNQLGAGKITAEEYSKALKELYTQWKTIHENSIILCIFHDFFVNLVRFKDF